MFSYCNNNPVGMVDDGGSRPLAMSDTVESAEDQMIAAKYMMEAASLTIAKNAAIGAADTAVAKGINKLKDTRNKYLIDKGTAPIYETTVSKYKVPIPKIKALKKFAKDVGIASFIALGVDIGFDIHDYMGWDLAGAITIDVTSFGAGVLAGLGIAALITASPVAIPAAVGIIASVAIGSGISYAGDMIKNTWLKKRF